MFQTTVNTYSFKWLNFKTRQWSKRGIRVQASNATEAYKQVEEILKKRGQEGPYLTKWKYVS